MSMGTEDMNEGAKMTKFKNYSLQLELNEHKIKRNQTNCYDTTTTNGKLRFNTYKIIYIDILLLYIVFKQTKFSFLSIIITIIECIETWSRPARAEGKH